MLSLVLPTYNESENLPGMLQAASAVLKDIPHEIIVVDDDSPDGTWQVAHKLSRQFDRVRVIRRVGRRGLSSAVIEGFLSAKGDVLVVADADGQHDLGLLPKLYNAVVDGNEMAIGSRYVEGGGVGQWDERRHFMSKIATGLAIKLCKVRVSDPMSGFFAIDRELFVQIASKLNPRGFKILLDLLVHAPSDIGVVEIPFTFGVRTHGESKLSRRVQIEFLEYLYDSTVGRFVPLTLIKYCMVGTIGVAISLVAYYAASRLLFGGLPNTLLHEVSMPLLVSIEAGILFNFLLNNSWTFGHAKLRGWRMIRGLLSYNVVCAFGALANYAITAFFFSYGAAEILSLIAGGFVGMIWNYTMSKMFTWKA
jgi:dolichol-phosphate mannosyltransferase